MFEDRKIIFNRYRNFTTMFEELTNFGVSSHDDCVDALVWLVTGLMKRGKLATRLLIKKYFLANFKNHGAYCCSYDCRYLRVWMVYQ